MLYSLRLLLSARPMLQLQHSWSTFLSGTVEEAERDMAGLKIIVTTFVSGFSYEKIIDQLKAAKLEEFGKIHKTFSDIQNQILSIPISTMIVATQMKKANGWDVQAISNTAIIIGSLIFAISLIISLFNQMQTLNTIEEEVEYKKKQAKKLYKSIYEDICITFDAIDRRLFAQRIAIWCVGAVLAISVIYSVAIYFFLTY